MHIIAWYVYIEAGIKDAAAQDLSKPNHHEIVTIGASEVILLFCSLHPPLVWNFHMPIFDMFSIFQQNSPAQFSQWHMTRLQWKFTICFVYLHAQVLWPNLFQMFSKFVIGHFAFWISPDKIPAQFLGGGKCSDHNVSNFEYIHFWFSSPICF